MIVKNKEDIKYICLAYEQGYGKGLKGSTHTNPYCNKTEEFVAWSYGLEMGLVKASKYTAGSQDA